MTISPAHAAHQPASYAVSTQPVQTPVSPSTDSEATPTRLLLVDPDADGAARVVAAVAQRGIEVTWCRDGAEALLAMGAVAPSALVVATGVAIVSAAELVSVVRRQSAVPIFIGADTPRSGASALRAGASAVLARPYDVDTLVSLVLNLGTDPRPADPSDVLGASAVASAGAGGASSGPAVVIDFDRFEAIVNGRHVALSQRELEVLSYLVSQRGRVASQDQISQAVWGHPADTNTVVVHIKRLRAKLGSDAEHGAVIRTVRSAGYRLAAAFCEP